MARLDDLLFALDISARGERALLEMLKADLERIEHELDRVKEILAFFLRNWLGNKEVRQRLDDLEDELAELKQRLEKAGVI